MQSSPQVENGFTRIADEFLEALIYADYPASVIRFMLIVVRETWGWQRKEAPIPASRFTEAFGGVTKRRIEQIRDDCLRHNLIEVEHGDQFDTPTYRIQKRYMDWLTWKSLKPWNPPHPPGKPSAKEEVRSEASGSENEDLRTPAKEEVRSSCEGEGSLKHRESLKENYRENDRAQGDDEYDGRPRDGDDLSDIPYLKSRYPATAQWLWTNVRHWKPKIQHRWLRAIATAIESPSDTWLADDLQAAELLKKHPPKAADENIPGKWLERMEQQAPAAPPRDKPSDDITRQRIAEIEASGWFDAQEASQ